MAMFDCLLFDLDDTLYPLNSGISSEVGKNIKKYMAEKMGLEESKIENLCNLLYKNYGTTMAGLRAIGYHFDYDEYHSYVHERLPYNKIKRDTLLKHMLKSIPIRKLPWDKDAKEIFDIVGHFARSGSVEQLPRTPVRCKPDFHAMDAALKLFDVNPSKAVFFDDSVRNIQAGKRLGLHTVLIGTSHRVDGADHAIESIHNIRAVLPEL